MSNAAKPYYAVEYPDDLTAEKFRKGWQPFGQRYTGAKKVDNQTGALFEHTEWRTYESSLTDYRIDLAILERVWLGYFSSIWTPFFSVDIDDHKPGKSWQKPSPKVIATFLEVVKRLHHIDPTYLVQTPHGFHAYWFLTQRIPNKVLQIAGRQRLHGLPVEILPTPKQSLRIPSRKRFLNPHTFETAEYSDNMRRYHPYCLFDADYTHTQLRAELGPKERQELARNLRSERSIEKIEESLIPIVSGHSNEPYCKLVAAYFYAGFSEQDAFERFMTVLWQSQYRGELLNPGRLKQRIKSSYDNLSKKGLYSIWQPRIEKELEITDILFIENLIKIQPFARQRIKPITYFLENLCRWLNYQDGIFQDKEEFAWWSWVQQPKYATCRNAGLYPLPVSMMKCWNHRYSEVVNWLCGLGVLEKATGYWFDKDYRHNNHCRYFKVNRGVEEKTNEGAELIIELANLGLKQSEIANKLGVAQSTVSRWFRGELSLPRGNWQSTEEFLKYARSAPNIYNTPIGETDDYGDPLGRLIKELERL